MEDMNEIEQICFEMISCVGAAKSCYVNSIAKAKEGDFATAAELVKQGDEAYNEGHGVHMKLLQAEASGAGMETLPLLLLHAEDQMASAETCKLMALNFADTYRELLSLKEKLNA